MTETEKLLLDTLRTLMSELEGLENTRKTTNYTMLYAKQLETVGGTGESLGGVKRAGYAIEREKSRGMGFGR